MGLGAWFWVMLSLRGAITFIGLLVAFVFAAMSFIFLHIFLVGCVFAPPSKVLVVLIHFSQIARILELCQHGDPIAAGVCILLLFRAHCQIKINCRLFSAAVTLVLQCNGPCVVRLAFALLACCVPLFPPKERAEDVDIVTTSNAAKLAVASNAAERALFHELTEVIERMERELSPTFQGQPQARADPAFPAQLSQNQMVTVPRDGLCLCHACIAAYDAEQWCVSHGEEGWRNQGTRSEEEAEEQQAKLFLADVV